MQIKKARVMILTCYNLKFRPGTLCEQQQNNEMEKDYRSIQENQRYQGKISCKDGHNKGQKWHVPNRNIKY